MNVWSVQVTPTDQNIIMFQLKSLKQHIYYRNQQLDGINYKNDDDNVFSMTLPSLRSNKNYLDPMRNVVFQYKPACHLKYLVIVISIIHIIQLLISIIDTVSMVSIDM